MKKETLAPQSLKNCIKLEDGIRRTTNWRKAIKPFYNNDESKIPHAVFIPFVDIAELQNMADEICFPGTDKPMYIVGVRAYFSLPDPTEEITDGSNLTALLVPVYQTNAREGGRPFVYDGKYPNYDLIVPASLEEGRMVLKAHAAGDEETATIFDITQPCPNLCDVKSKLFGPVPNTHRNKH